MTLEELRAEIDQADRDLVFLLNRRARISQQVGQIKREQAGVGREPHIYQPDREAQVYAQVDALNQGPLPNSALHAIYREILSSSRAVQRPLRVGYLGPVATFAYEAAKRHFGSEATVVPCRTIADVFVETEKRTVDYGVVPVENSTGGAVISTLDSFLETELQICAEILLPVSHNLLSRGKLDQITQVYSHPQALAQCRRWLAEWLPRATLVETASTALAAQMVQDEQSAAISTEAASEVYGLPLVARRIEDESTNVTRFLVIGPHRSEPTGHDRTALVFAVHDRVGALQDGLRWFAENAINLTRIESRPSRRRLWEYVFFVDLDGHPADDHVARAIEGLRQSCAFVRVLGTWPASRVAEPVAE
ncbi:MAG TPA: prephenate dehydratase [Chloroflexota bacterium]|nr:prephenate dehydratase [Chloroflexota bacterium]